MTKRNGIKCGHCKQYHPTVQDVWECALEELAQIAAQEAEIAAEMAYERHLEDRGWEQYEEDRREEMARCW